MMEINALLDRSISTDGFLIAREVSGEGGRHKAIDLSSIDFEALAKRFAKTTRKSIELEQLRAAVRKQLDTLVRANPTRADFLTKFEALIESYNAGSRNIDDLFKELLALSRSLSDEEQRHVRTACFSPPRPPSETAPIGGLLRVIRRGLRRHFLSISG